MDKLDYRVDKNGIVGVQLRFATKRNSNVTNDNQPYCIASTILPLGNDSCILEPCYLVGNMFKYRSAVPNMNSYLYYIFNEIFGLYKAVIYYNRSGVVIKCDILQADASSLRVVPKSENKGTIECYNWCFLNPDLAPYIKNQIIQSSNALMFKEEFR